MVARLFATRWLALVRNTLVFGDKGKKHTRVVLFVCVKSLHPPGPFWVRPLVMRIIIHMKTVYKFGFVCLIFCVYIFGLMLNRRATKLE